MMLQAILQQRSVSHCTSHRTGADLPTTVVVPEGSLSWWSRFHRWLPRAHRSLNLIISNSASVFRHSTGRFEYVVPILKHAS
jgi:hypothetical protein